MFWGLRCGPWVQCKTLFRLPQIRNQPSPAQPKPSPQPSPTQAQPPDEATGRGPDSFLHLQCALQQLCQGGVPQFEQYPHPTLISMGNVCPLDPLRPKSRSSHTVLRASTGEVAPPIPSPHVATACLPILSSYGVLSGHDHVAFVRTAAMLLHIVYTGRVHH